jgi:integrase
MAGVLARRCRKFGQDSAAADWLELEEFIIFMVGTFLRPSEWKLLRQKDISIHKGEHPHLQIAVSNGKTKMRKVISMPSVVGMYERKVRREGIDPERYLFKNQYPNRATAYERMADSFNRLLDETGLGPDEFGRKRTLYSLRHTALMLRLLNGDNVDLLTLAKNAGTSVSQLERFYCSHIDPAMKIANLQSFRFGGSR